MARKADFDTVEQGLEDKLDKDESNNIVARLKESRREDLAQHERGQKAVEGTSSNLSVIPFTHPLYTFIAVHTPMYTRYTCIHHTHTSKTSKHCIFTIHTPINTYIHPIYTTVGTVKTLEGRVTDLHTAVKNTSKATEQVDKLARRVSKVHAAVKEVSGALTSTLHEELDQVKADLSEKAGLDDLSNVSTQVY